MTLTLMSPGEEVERSSYEDNTTEYSASDRTGALKEELRGRRGRDQSVLRL